MSRKSIEFKLAPLDFSGFPNLFFKRQFKNSGFENVPCTCISITRKNNETVIQEIDKFEIDSHLKRKAYWKIISEQNVLQSIR